MPSVTNSPSRRKRALLCGTSLSEIQLPPDLEQPRIQTLLSTVADILTVRSSIYHLTTIDLKSIQNHTPDDKTIFKHLSSLKTRIRKVGARKRIAPDEQDREGDSESDHAATMAPAPARKQNARAETKRKMVARSETEAEDRKVPRKEETQERRNSIACSRRGWAGLAIVRTHTRSRSQEESC